MCSDCDTKLIRCDIPKHDCKKEFKKLLKEMKERIEVLEAENKQLKH